MQRHLPILVVFSLFAFAGGLLMLVPDGDWPPLLIYFPVLALLALILYRKGIKSIDPHFPASLFLLAFLLKLSSSLARYWTAFDFYGGAADAGLYHQQGQYVAQFFQEFDFSILEYYQFRGEGTTSLIHITGLIYTVLPPSLSGIFLFFASLAFTGSVLCYRAFRLAFPNSAPHFYRLIIFFLPTILFWPASVGKESWAFFCSGFVAYGLAKYVRQQRLSGGLLAGMGLLLMFPVRPHFAAFMVVALAAVYLVSLRQTSRQSPLTWLVNGSLVVGLGMVMLPASQDYVGMGELSLEEFEDSYDYYQGKTSQDTSSFSPYSILSPVGWVMGPITVLFRPFPWEAHSSQMMIAAVESLVWLGLVWTRRRVFWARLRTVGADPWVTFLVVYTLLMILAFTTIGNFGILVRQRTSFLPFFWMLFV